MFVLHSVLEPKVKASSKDGFDAGGTINELIKRQFKKHVFKAFYHVSLFTSENNPTERKMLKMFWLCVMEANGSRGHFTICVISFRNKMSFVKAKIRKEKASFGLAKRAVKFLFKISSIRAL